MSGAREVWHYSNGKRIPGPCRDLRIKRGVSPRDSATGYSFQLPKYWKHSERHIESGPNKGRCCWTTEQEAIDMVKRAQDAGEDITWDKGGGIGEE